MLFKKTIDRCEHLIIVKIIFDLDLKKFKFKYLYIVYESWELKIGVKLKSLILAQIERWRHALHMQVERQHECLHLVASGERVSNTSERVLKRGITHRKMC